MAAPSAQRVRVRQRLQLPPHRRDLVPRCVRTPGSRPADGRRPARLSDPRPLAWAILALWPFSRLVHAWSIPFEYIGRPYILYRRRYQTACYGPQAGNGPARTGSRAFPPASGAVVMGTGIVSVALSLDRQETLSGSSSLSLRWHGSRSGCCSPAARCVTASASTERRDRQLRWPASPAPPCSAPASPS